MKKWDMKWRMVLAACLIFSLFSNEILMAAGNYDKPGLENVTERKWADPISCHTFASSNGSTLIVYCIKRSGKLTLNIDKFSKNGKRKSHKTLDIPGSIWGGTVYHAPMLLYCYRQQIKSCLLHSKI